MHRGDNRVNIGLEFDIGPVPPSAVREFFEPLAEPGLGIIEHVCHRVAQDADAILGRNFLETPPRDGSRRNFRTQIKSDQFRKPRPAQIFAL